MIEPTTVTEHMMYCMARIVGLNASSTTSKRGLGMIKKIESYPELADPQLQPRYSGIPTFFRLPHTVRLDEVDIGLVGVPFDGGVTNRSGARHGPRDIRNQSTLIRKINQATGVAPFDLVRVADLGDAWIERPFELPGGARRNHRLLRYRSCGWRNALVGRR